MATAPVSDLIPLINDVLNETRRELGIGTDAELGERLGVSDVTIYSWRKAHLGKSARVLLPLFIRHYRAKQSDNHSHFGRRRRRIAS